MFSTVDIILRSRVEDIEISFTGIRNLKNTGQISAPVAVIRSTPDGAQPVVVQDLVSFLAELVGPQDMRHAVDLEKLPHHLSAERVPRTSRGEGELIALRVRVRPNQIRHGPFVGDLTEPVDDFDLIDRVDRRGEAAMDAEYLVVYDDAEGEEIEHVCEVVPDVGVAVFPGTFCVKAVGLGDPTGLVVAADQVDAVGVPQF